MALTTRDLLATLQLRGVGSATVRTLYKRTVSRATMPSGKRLSDLLSEIPKLRSSLPSSASIDAAYKAADDILDRNDRYNVITLSPLDEAYPLTLLDLEDFPPVLFVKGCLATLANPKKMAIVGTRHPSQLGLRLARKIAIELSSINVCVVSGLALGIDTAAHQGAIKASGSTIAVLAHGLDQIAPKTNEGLAASILENNGVLLSEYEVGIRPRPPQFVVRNRLQSGLSRGSVVVESGFSGGSIYQGKFTSEQHRLLFVVMPDPTLPRMSEFKREGAERLRREFNGKPVAKLEDILDSLPEFRSPSLEVTPVSGEVSPSNNGSTELPLQQKL